MSFNTMLGEQPLFTEISLLIEGGTTRHLPMFREDCLPGGNNAERPCRWGDCQYHLKPKGSSTHSCVLDVADLGGITLEEVGEVLGVTRERIRQIEEKALRKLKRRGVFLKYRD